MNFKRIGRMLVCLILVCCLIVNISPIRAKATESISSYLAVTIPVDVGVSAIMNGIGVIPGEDPAAYRGIRQKIVDYLYEQALVFDGKIEAWKAEQVSNSGKYYIDVSLPEAILLWLFNDGGVLVNTSLPSSDLIANHDRFTMYFNSAVSHDYGVCIFCTDGSWHIYYNTTSAGIKFYYQESDDAYHISGKYMHISDTTSNDGSNTSFAREIVSSYSCVGKVNASDDPYATNYDVELGYIGNPSLPWPEAYPTWYNNSVAIPGTGTDDDIVIVPIGIGDTSDDTEPIPQEDIWEGISIVTDDPINPDASVDTVTPTWLESFFAPVISAIVSFISFWEQLMELLSPITKFFTDVVSGHVTIADILTDVKTIGQSIFDTVVSIPKAIGQVITDALTWAFAISDTFIATKVEALTLKYPYFDTFLALGTDLKSFFVNLGVKPPVIYIDLSAATGSYYWGSRQVFLDLTWYSAYKPTMDTIIGGFIWFWLAWRVFLSLPGIISGASGAAGSVLRFSERSTRNDSKGGSE